MEENLTQTNLGDSVEESVRPEDSDNQADVISETFSLNENSVQNEGQSVQADPSGELILGKFKSVEDLSKAYEELQRFHGHSSEELGALRKELASVRQLQESMEQYQKIQSGYLDIVRRDQEKYTGPEYFQDPTFREIYKEALMSFGENLDTDKLVNLLESYVSARIFSHERKRAAQTETQKVLDSMSYNKNSKSAFTPPKKRFDEMTEKEIDELLDRLI